MKIKVMQKHIEDGFMRRNCFCPVALAVKDATNSDNVSINYDTVEVTKGNRVVAIVALPAVALRRIKTYDNCGLMSPFDFELDMSNIGVSTEGVPL